VRIIFLFIILFGFFINSYGESDSVGNVLRFGLFGGRTDVNGYYDNKISSGITAGIFVNYSFFNNRSLLLESELAYTDLSLSESSSSEFNYYSFSLGPVLYFPVWRHIKPYAGLSAGINYFKLTAIKTKQNDSTLKPGAAVKAGLYIPAYKNFSVNLGMKYAASELSGKTFSSINYFAGAFYSYDFFPREKAERTAMLVEIDEYYESGLSYFKQGDGISAKKYFAKVMKNDNNYKDVKNYNEIISSNEGKYSKAVKLISENNLYDALPLLIDSEKYLINAREKLKDTRLLLSKEEKSLVDLGVEAYNHNDYEKCIFYMKRVQLINPDNESAGIYLPRALQRYNALQKIE
jgi:hypothetical protein